MKGGSVADGLLGALVGSFVGYVFGACLGIGVAGVWTGVTGNQGVAIIAQFSSMLGILVAGAVVGAWIGMRPARKAGSPTAQ
jgi:hypothetical protein